MSVSVSAQGDQAAVISTEHTLGTDAAAGTYVLNVDLSPMQAGDTVKLRIKAAVRTTGTGSTARTISYSTYSDVQTDPTNKSVGPIASHLGVTVTLQQTAGTGRTFPWVLERVG